MPRGRELDNLTYGDKKALKLKEESPALFGIPSVPRIAQRGLRDICQLKVVLDDDGVDGIFLTDVGNIPIQIKSSEFRVNQFQKDHPNIPAVCISHVNLPRQKILQICLKTIKRQRRRMIKLARREAAFTTPSLLRR